MNIITTTHNISTRAALIAIKQSEFMGVMGASSPDFQEALVFVLLSTDKAAIIRILPDDRMVFKSTDLMAFQERCMRDYSLAL